MAVYGWLYNADWKLALSSARMAVCVLVLDVIW